MLANKSNIVVEIVASLVQSGKWWIDIASLFWLFPQFTLLGLPATQSVSWLNEDVVAPTVAVQSIEHEMTP